jgi:hypothetical protein
MLTIFALPKPFEGHIGSIQRNALRSWKRLGPDCQIILCGAERGIAAAAAEFGVEHIPDVERSEFGTPLVNSAFSRAEEAATHDVLCYANADLIFFSDLIDAICRVASANRRFLLVGRCCNLDVEEFAALDESWETDLRHRVAAEAKMRGHDAVDFFVFRRGSLGPLPPFAVGRPGWDNWMIWRARKLRLPVVDITRSTLVIHQSHDFDYVKNTRGYDSKGPESVRNRSLMRLGQFLTLDDATHRLEPDRLVTDRGDLRRQLRTELFLYSWTIPIYRALRWLYQLGPKKLSSEGTGRKN